MIYFNFSNYDEFKSVFGMRKTNEGQFVRKDKITLNVLKDMFCNKNNDPERWDKFFVKKSVMQPMSQNDLIVASKQISGGTYDNILIDGMYELNSDIYRVDSDGLCFDGDTKSIRYEKEGHIYKMKASKFFAKIFSEHGLDDFYGTKAQTYCCEKFAESWTAYAESKVGKDLYTLHVGEELEDFEHIYTSSVDMGSCMRNSGQYHFYYEAVKASAAWLEDKCGNMVCRCIIFNECKQRGTGKMFRIAERQYAVNQSDTLKSILVARLYAEGYIDAHKRVGAGCGDADDICDKNNDPLDNPYFSTPCYLDCGDTLSYQDSFKYYDFDSNVVYNHTCNNYTHELDTTDSSFEYPNNYDDWADEYTRDDVRHAYWFNDYGSERDGYVSDSNIGEFFTYVDCGTYRYEWVYDGDVVWIGDCKWCKYDEGIVEIDGEWYDRDDVYYCEDIEDYAVNAISWDHEYYADYTYSELLKKDVPDCMFDEVEAEYAKEHGYVMNDDDEWVLAEELEEVCA